jgi:transcriptional regulator with XRE-family HTH domain
MIRLGQRLREERLKRGLTLEDVMKSTKIRTAFLSAIEKGEYQKLPASSYAQGFVVNYATFLGFPKREALALFRREFDEGKVFTDILPERFSNPADKAFPRIKIHQTALAIGFAFLLLLSYLGYSYKDAFLNPPLTVTAPQGHVVKAGDVLVAGKTNPYATVTVNNAPVSIESDGKFAKEISIFSGRTSIVVKAKNRFGRETVVTKTVQATE